MIPWIFLDNLYPPKNMGTVANLQHNFPSVVFLLILDKRYKINANEIARTSSDRIDGKGLTL